MKRQSSITVTPKKSRKKPRKKNKMVTSSIQIGNAELSRQKSPRAVSDELNDFRMFIRNSDKPKVFLIKFAVDVD